MTTKKTKDPKDQKAAKKNDKPVKEAKADPANSSQFLTDEGKKATLVTKEGLQKLNEEYKYLKDTKRHEVAERLKEAISFGDLSENSEYEEAKNEQAFVEGRIFELEQMIKNAKVIAETHGGARTVQLGSTVHLKNLTIKSDKPEIYTIVGSTEANAFEGRISNESPVGSAILDRSKGEKIKLQVPAGMIEYEILKVE